MQEIDYIAEGRNADRQVIIPDLFTALACRTDMSHPFVVLIQRLGIYV